MNTQTSFRILSLDGGGIRGAFSAAFLAAVESKLGIRIAEHFDLIAGTSTGGIIAAALAVGEPASRIVDMYRVHGLRIFSRTIPERSGIERAKIGLLNCFIKRACNSDYDAVNSPKYDSNALNAALTGVFQDKKVADVKLTSLVIPSVNLVTGTTKVFKTPHLPEFYRDKKYSLVSVLLATTAAPTYFPHTEIDPGSAYVDGGLWANNPSVVAYVEAMKIVSSRHQQSGMSANPMRLLSVGTGELQTCIAPKKQTAGQLYWVDKAFDLTINSQSQAAHNQMNYLLGEPHYQRVNFRLPDSSWQLDSVAHLERLIHHGEEIASHKMRMLEQLFFPIINGTTSFGNRETKKESLYASSSRS